MNFENDYLGLNNFIWYVGVVEDRNDPLRMGRVKVRPYGWYAADKAKVPVDSLPWAQVIQSPTSAAMGDIGTSPTGLLEGSWVVGFFLDGQRLQRPIVMGSISGIPTELASEQDFENTGFTDPNGVYPDRKDEPDVNRLTRNDITFAHEILDPKEEARTLEVETPPTIQGNTWNELAVTYGAEYPYNHVRETESGHIVEFDDTPGQERIHEYHRTGTFYEIDEVGNKVTRIVGDEYEVTAGTKYVNIKGTCNITIEQDCNMYIKGNWNIEVDGNKTEKIHGDVTETYGSNPITNFHSTTVTGFRNKNILGLENENVLGAVVHIYGGVKSETVAGSSTLGITGNYDVDAARIDLN